MIGLHGISPRLEYLDLEHYLSKPGIERNDVGSNRYCEIASCLKRRIDFETSDGIAGCGKFTNQVWRALTAPLTVSFFFPPIPSAMYGNYMFS